MNFISEIIGIPIYWMKMVKKQNQMVNQTKNSSQ